MREVLIILTGKYPYANGESFLANEIKYIPDNYDKIYVFPILVYENRSKLQVKYNIPEDPRLQFILGNDFKNPNKLLVSFLKTIFSRDFWHEILQLIKSQKISFEKIKLLILYCLRCHHAADKAIDVLKNSGDKITVYSYWMDYDAYAACLIKRKLGDRVYKCITRCHRGDLYEDAARGGYLPMRNLILDTMDAVYSISDDGVAYIKSQYQIDNENLRISRLGTFDHGCNHARKSDVLKVVSCSWVRPVKRVYMIAEALKEADFPVQWTHYGNGSDMKKLEDAVSDLNNQFVQCSLAGECDNEKLMDIYKTQEFDVFVNVSESEGVPVSIMEAMSFGKIIIATDVGGTRELIEDGVNGFLLPVDFRVSQLTVILQRIYNSSEEEIRNMSAASRRIWQSKYNAERNFSEFYDAIK